MTFIHVCTAVILHFSGIMISVEGKKTTKGKLRIKIFHFHKNINSRDKTMINVTVMILNINRLLIFLLFSAFL